MSEPTIGDVIAAVLGLRLPAVSELDGRIISAKALAAQLADLTGLAADDAYSSLCYVPDNFLPLLDSPQGWTALACVVAADCGVPEPALRPTLH
ncbi:MAG: hypothetical protein V4579_12040 [Pseudomonadota bacterium]